MRWNIALKTDEKEMEWVIRKTQKAQHKVYTVIVALEKKKAETLENASTGMFAIAL